MNPSTTYEDAAKANRHPEILLFDETQTNKLYQSLVPVYERHQRMPRLYSFLAKLSNVTEQFSSMLIGDAKAFEPREDTLEEYTPRQLEEARKTLGVSNLGQKKFIIMNSMGDLGVFSRKGQNLSFSRSCYDLFCRDISDVGVIVLPKNKKGEQFKHTVCELLFPLEERV